MNRFEQNVLSLLRFVSDFKDYLFVHHIMCCAKIDLCRDVFFQRWEVARKFRSFSSRFFRILFSGYKFVGVIRIEIKVEKLLCFFSETVKSVSETRFNSLKIFFRMRFPNVLVFHQVWFWKSKFDHQSWSPLAVKNKTYWEESNMYRVKWSLKAQPKTKSKTLIVFVNFQRLFTL